MISSSAGARPCSTARSSISGLSASITARTSFFTAGCGGPRTSGRRRAGRGSAARGSRRGRRSRAAGTGSTAPPGPATSCRRRRSGAPRRRPRGAPERARTASLRPGSPGTRRGCRRSRRAIRSRRPRPATRRTARRRAPSRQRPGRPERAISRCRGRAAAPGARTCRCPPTGPGRPAGTRATRPSRSWCRRSPRRCRRSPERRSGSGAGRVGRLWRRPVRRPGRCRTRGTFLNRGGVGASGRSSRSATLRSAMTIDDRPPRSTSRDLERYAGLFASRTRVMKSSAMRDMMSITTRPEVISFAGGLPDTSTFPRDTFASVTNRIAMESSAKALQYGPTEGMPGMLECIREVMAAEDMHVDPEDICVTTGGQQVIDLVCKTLIDPGDAIVAEAPTYPGAVPTFSSYQADVVQIDIDNDGMRVDLLEETLDRLDREGRKPKFVYTIPSFQNPGGVTMSLERRRALVRIAHEQELVVLEDNPYGLLRYEGEPLPTLYSLDGGRYVIYLGTFSKILSAGLRLGWAAAPKPILERLNLGKQAADLCSSPLNQYFVAAYFEHRDWRTYLTTLRALYRRRRDV